MLPRNHPDRIQITFDDRRLVANAGLLLPATLARHLGLPELVRQRLDLGDAPGRANTSDKMMTLVASALAGGDCIDDADVLRTGGTACTLGGTLKAPSTLGTFLRSFRWGHVRQLDRVSRELLARAWQAGAGPGDAANRRKQSVSLVIQQSVPHRPDHHRLLTVPCVPGHLELPGPLRHEPQAVPHHQPRYRQMPINGVVHRPLTHITHINPAWLAVISNRAT